MENNVRPILVFYVKLSTNKKSIDSIFEMTKNYPEYNIFVLARKQKNSVEVELLSASEERGDGIPQELVDKIQEYALNDVPDNNIFKRLYRKTSKFILFKFLKEPDKNNIFALSHKLNEDEKIILTKEGTSKEQFTKDCEEAYKKVLSEYQEDERLHESVLFEMISAMLIREYRYKYIWNHPQYEYFYITFPEDKDEIVEYKIKTWYQDEELNQMLIDRIKEE